LGKYDSHPKGIFEVWKFVQIEWNKIPVKSYLNLIEIMPRRIISSIKAKGGYKNINLMFI